VTANQPGRVGIANGDWKGESCFFVSPINYRVKAMVRNARMNEENHLKGNRLRCLDRSRKTHAILVFLVVVPMFWGTANKESSAEPQRSRLAPLLYQNLPSRVPNEYIVVFKPGTPRDVVQAVQGLVIRRGRTIKHVYSVVLIGFSCTLSVDVVHALRAEPSVASVSSVQNGFSDAVQQLDPPPNPRPNWPAHNWPKGLDRTSERGIPLDGKYTYSETGTSVHAYVIDTGILASHEEFGGRVSDGRNVASNNNDTSDCNGHGTHMAGTIGGVTVGIAKQVILHPIRATNCESPHTTSNYIAAIDWVTNHIMTKGYVGKAVVNFSNSWDYIDTNLNDAVRTSIASGITYVISAGNRNQDACGWSPSSINAVSGAPKPIVVGAVNPMNDTRWVDEGNPNLASNTGVCLNLFAPGAGIVSAWKGNNVDYHVLSGTSSAAAHVTGVVARILDVHVGITLSPEQVWRKLHDANNVCPTPCSPQPEQWQGVMEPRTKRPITGSPNELLHYGLHKNLIPPPAPNNLTVSE